MPYFCVIFFCKAMTQSKAEIFNDDLRALAGFAKALAHPARIAILNFLASSGTCITGDISDEIPLSRTTVGQHLKELKKAGLIKGEIEGVKVNYCLNQEVVCRMNSRFEQFLGNLKKSDQLNCTE